MCNIPAVILKKAQLVHDHSEHSRVSQFRTTEWFTASNSIVTGHFLLCPQMSCTLNYYFISCTQYLEIAQSILLFRFVSESVSCIAHHTMLGNFRSLMHKCGIHKRLEMSLQETQVENVGDYKRLNRLLKTGRDCIGDWNKAIGDYS